MGNFYVYDWPSPCQHRLFVDRTGNRVNPTMIERGSRIIKAAPVYSCPACAHPEAGHPDIVTVPKRPETSIMPPNHPVPMFSGPDSGVVRPQSSIQAGPSTARVTSTAVVLRPQQTRPTPHGKNQPCPSRSPFCHFHHSEEHACHVYWEQCRLARKAAASTYYAKGVWRGCPQGWHTEHAPCVDPQNPVRCSFHHKLYLDGLSAQERANLGL